jgi:alpha-tubulin suppressor-like RCC1 family protein
MGMGSNASNELLQGAPDKHSPVQVLSAVNVKEVAAGRYHSLYLTDDGQLYGMGDNQYGQLGQGAGIPLGYNAETSVPIHIADGVKAIAAAWHHSLYITNDGTLYGMGQNNWGQLGVGRKSKSEFTPVKIAVGVKRVYAGTDVSMYITEAGDLYVMGCNINGGLGTGNKADVLTPVKIASNVWSAAVGADCSLYVTESGTLYGAGFLHLRDIANSLVPTKIADGVSTIKTTGGGFMYTTAVGYLYAWGNNYGGQLGAGADVSIHVPKKISVSTKRVDRVSMVLGHTLVLTVDGDLYAMGANYSGQLGDGTTSDSTVPKKIASNVTRIATGESHSLYVRNDGHLFAMGNNASGELGDGSTAFCVEPVTVRDGVAMAAAGYYMAFFLTPDGILYKMGADGSPAQRVASNVRTVSSFCSSSHALYITNDNKLFGLGRNQAGELGASASNPTETPVLLATGVAACAVGGSSSYYISTTGDLYGMGSGEYGELGGGVATSTSQPRKIASNVKAAAAGTVSCVFLTNDGALYGCGDPESLGCDLSQYARQAISNQYGTQVLASPVLLDTNVSAIAAGWFHVLYLKGNTLYGRGAQDGGQLGNGVPVVDWDTYVSASYDGYSFALAPVRIATNVVAMAGGEDSTFYITQDGKLYATGMQSCGELGDGTIMARSTPVQVACNVVGVVAGKATTLFLSGGAQSLVIRDEPSSQSVAAGGTTVLSVTVSGAAAPTYQWQISTNGGASWSDVSSGAGYSGGTTARLSIAGVTKSMNGYQ